MMYYDVLHYNVILLGCLLVLCTSKLTGLSDSLLKSAQVIMLANLGHKINIPASDEER